MKLGVLQPDARSKPGSAGHLLCETMSQPLPSSYELPATWKTSQPEHPARPDLTPVPSPPASPLNANFSPQRRHANSFPGQLRPSVRIRQERPSSVHKASDASQTHGDLASAFAKMTTRLHRRLFWANGLRIMISVTTSSWLPKKSGHVVTRLKKYIRTSMSLCVSINRTLKVTENNSYVICGIHQHN